MASIAVADTETRGAADWAAEVWRAISLKSSGIIYTLIVNISFHVCIAYKCMDIQMGPEQLVQKFVWICNKV